MAKKKHVASGPNSQGEAPAPATTKGKRKGKSSSPIACVTPNLIYLSPVSATGNEILIGREGITHIISIGRNPWAQIDGITYHRLGLKDEEEADINPVIDRVCEIMDGIVPPVEPSGGEEMGGGINEMDEVGLQEDKGEKGQTQQEIPGEGPEDGFPEFTNRDIKGKGKAREASGYYQENKREKGPKNDKRVLFHCSAAISRSPAIVAGYLMKRRGMTLRETLGVLVAARDAISPNIGFMRQLCEMEREVFGLGDGDQGSVDISLLKGGGRLVSCLGEK